MVTRAASAMALAILWAAGTASATEGEALYLRHCAGCHHAKRVGLVAPPLLPGYFSRPAGARIEGVIANGLPATQMPEFATTLRPNEITAIAAYIQAPAPQTDLTWTREDINESRRDYRADGAAKLPSSALEELTLVMEKGERSLVALDGGTLEKLASFHVGEVHGGPKFSHSLDTVYAVARDGLVTRISTTRLASLTQVKAGISSRALAVSGDDRHVAVANLLPPGLILFDSELRPVGELPLEAAAGGLYALPERRQFALSLRGKAELWLIDDHPPFNVTRQTLPAPFEDLSLVPGRPLMLGAAREGTAIYLYDYEKGMTLASFPASGMPHLASAAFWRREGELFAGINHIKKPELIVISLDTLTMAAVVPLAGAGWFVRSHTATPHIWTGTDSDKIALIDKADYSRIRYLIPQPGHKAMHIEFCAGGKYALVSIPEKEGAVAVYDTETLELVKTIPFNHPAGKYNASLKTFPARGLSANRSSAFAGPAAREPDHIPSAASTDGLAGRDVYENYCMGCHNIMHEAFGPSFQSIARARDSGQVRAHVLAPRASARALGYRLNSMPYIPLSNEQVTAVVDFVMSAKRRE